MPWPLVGDVAYVVRIEALGATPLVIDGSGTAKPTLDRTLGLRPRLIAASPAKLLPHVVDTDRSHRRVVTLDQSRGALIRPSHCDLRSGLMDVRGNWPC